MPRKYLFYLSGRLAVQHELPCRQASKGNLKLTLGLPCPSCFVTFRHNSAINPTIRFATLGPLQAEVRGIAKTCIHRGKHWRPAWSSRLWLEEQGFSP